METRDVSIMTAESSGGDPSLLMAVGVATVAVIGLAVLQLPKILNEEGGEKKTKPKPPTRVKASDPVVKTTTVDIGVPKKDKKSLEIGTKGAEETSVKTESTSSEEASSSSSGEEEAKEPENASKEKEDPNNDVKWSKPVPALFFAGDDLQREQAIAVESFELDNQKGLENSLWRIVGLVRTARTELEEEKQKNQGLETKLKEVSEEMVNLEDRYELEQNKVASTIQELDVTRATLTTTQKNLKLVQESQEELKQERRSLRKLGRSAWQLSKRRIGKRLPFRRNRGKDEVSSD